MFKFLIIFFIIILGLIHSGNYMDYKNGRISKKELDRRIRLFIVLIFVFIGILIWVKKR